jgi:hypothetical protein
MSRYTPESRPLTLAIAYSESNVGVGHAVVGLAKGPSHILQQSRVIHVFIMLDVCKHSLMIDNVLVCGLVGKGIPLVESWPCVRLSPGGVITRLDTPVWT